MESDLSSAILPQNAKRELPNGRGLYLWFANGTETVVYVGVALGVGGLRRRIVHQHLNPSYLLFNPAKHTGKDHFQMALAVQRPSKDGKSTRLGIDKSAFRKSIGRKLKIGPGEGTVNHIRRHFYLKIFLSDDVEMLRAKEAELIRELKPQFNTTHMVKDATRPRDLRRDVTVTRKGRLLWKAWATVPDTHSFGHGVHFHDTRKPHDASLVAWLEGYEWLHGDPETVTIWCIAPDTITTTQALSAMKRAVARRVASRTVPCGPMTAHIEAHPNA